jgi:hypothetical protein
MFCDCNSGVTFGIGDNVYCNSDSCPFRPVVTHILDAYDGPQFGICKHKNVGYLFLTAREGDWAVTVDVENLPEDIKLDGQIYRTDDNLYQWEYWGERVYGLYTLKPHKEEIRRIRVLQEYKNKDKFWVARCKLKSKIRKRYVPIAYFTRLAKNKIA